MKWSHDIVLAIFLKFGPLFFSELAHTFRSFKGFFPLFAFISLFWCTVYIFQNESKCNVTQSLLWWTVKCFCAATSESAKNVSVHKISARTTKAIFRKLSEQEVCELRYNRLNQLHLLRLNWAAVFFFFFYQSLVLCYLPWKESQWVPYCVFHSVYIWE